jgi:hypothetical protein
MPLASGRKAPVEVSMKGRSPGTASTAAIVVTGRRPRPVIAMSVEFELEVSAPLASMSQIAFERTPPAVNQRPPPGVKALRPSETASEAKSVSAVL